MENKRRIPWGLVGLTLTGVCVGAAIGVLYAPKKGEETRKDLKNWLAAKREQTKNFFQRSKQTLVEKKASIAAAFKRQPVHNGARKEDLVAA